MGLFSSKKKTTVGTSVSRVMDDASMPDAIKTGVVKAIFENGDLPDYMMEELVGSVGIRAERMYEYGKKSYTHGLPSGQIMSSVMGRAEVLDVLQSIEGTAPMLDYVHYGPPNNLHIGWMQLVAQYGYNSVTNELPVLSATVGRPVYLHDMVVVVPSAVFPSLEAGVLYQWGTAAKAGYTPKRTTGTPTTRELISPSEVVSSLSAAEDYLLVTYTWSEVPVITGPWTTPGEIKYATLQIPVDGYSDTADYFHVKYAAGATSKYWMYEVGSGGYPALDALSVAPPTINGTFFPFAYFRYNKRSEIEDKTTAAYKTSKKLVKYLGMDYDMVAEAIDENPDIQDVEQAMLIMAVPANTTNELERRYLFQFFDNMYYAGDGERFTSPTQAGIYTARRGGTVAQSSLVIQDTRFKMALTNDGIFKRRVAGTIGPIATHDSGTSTDSTTTELVNGETGETYTVATPFTYHYYRQQISAGFYDEIQVRSLKTVFYVYENYTTIGDEEDSILLIPLDRSITREYSVPVREVLYSRSLHYVFNSRVVTKVKWYQTGFFKALMVIVAVVITIYSLGASGGLLSTLNAAFIVGGAQLVAVTLALGVFKALLVMAAVKLFVKTVGGELALAIAVIAAVAGAYMAFNAGSVTGAPWAQDLLSLSTNLSKGVTDSLQDMMKDLVGEADQFKLFMEEQTKLLDSANELLETSTLLSPFVIFGEKPDDFYNRTVHSGNIGAIGISAISSYVDIALTLPKLDDTLGGNLNVL